MTAPAEQRRSPWPLVHIVAGVATTVVVVMHPHCADSLLKGRRGDIYGSMVGVHTTMLGFALAALTIVLGYAELPRLQMLRQSPWYKEMYRVFTSAIRALTVASVLSVIALVGDRNAHPVNLLTALVAGSTVTALARLVRLLAVMERIVEIVIRNPARAPGT
jgi:hypothetical protein